jgi:hypothetical protein
LSVTKTRTFRSATECGQRRPVGSAKAFAVAPVVRGRIPRRIPPVPAPTSPIYAVALSCRRYGFSPPVLLAGAATLLVGSPSASTPLSEDFRLRGCHRRMVSSCGLRYRRWREREGARGDNRACEHHKESFRAHNSPFRELDCAVGALLSARRILKRQRARRECCIGETDANCSTSRSLASMASTASVLQTYRVDG